MAGHTILGENRRRGGGSGKEVQSEWSKEAQQVHHKKVGCTVEVHCTPETFLTDRGDGVKRNGVVGKLRFRFGPALMNQRALSARAMCFHGSFASQMGCSTAVVVTLGHSVSIPSSLSVSPTGFSYGYSPLNPLISSRVLSSTAIDSVGRRDRRAERIVLFNTKPGLRVQFLLLPKAGLDDNRPQVAADI